jgi:hypothetical protein
MALVVNKYKIFNPCIVHDGKPEGQPVSIPSSISEGSTFKVAGIDMNVFVLKELNSDFKFTVNSDVFNQGFYKIGCDV